MKSGPTPPYKFEGIGTHWTISVNQLLQAAASTRLEQAIRGRINDFDKLYSRFRSDSLVSEMSTRAGNYHLPDDARPLFDLYKQLYDVTGGTVTPLIGQLLSDAGYNAAYSLRPSQLAAAPEWDEVLVYDFPQLQLKQPALLDFGAAGKGYLVDIIGQLLEAHGVQEFVVDAGGDILHHGKPASGDLQVALEHPGDVSLAIGVANIGNQSLCGSAGNRRAWGQYHHIIDPRSLQSPRHIAGVWVVADSGLLADGLATALFFCPAIYLLKHFDFAYAVMYADNRLERSDNFPGQFYTQND